MVRNVVIGIVGLIGTLLLVSLIAVWFGLLQLPLMNINREVIQHSQQYVETKRSLLLSLMADAESAQTPEQRIAIINRFCEEYSYVDFDVPAGVDGFAGQNCR